MTTTDATISMMHTTPAVESIEEYGPKTAGELMATQDRATHRGTAFVGWELFPFRVTQYTPGSSTWRWDTWSVCFATAEEARNMALAIWNQERRRTHKVVVQTPANPADYRHSRMLTVSTFKRSKRPVAAA